ncbi:ATP-binding cassette domain-containing protein [Gordonia sp. HNM0687]|uniref:ATP-binding cassette domain-containing protein n=1 Tax=Gordonia mangrovi TaxID=2665643 RepID=A0A6L7GIP9_9ACTN|nr:ATP-binding cassette domain-containing protein [Gordonia mangrovi]MXP19850.1 ATP-binding cassette domain-containing protein [Gordonia mangrovi]UVF80627.1 ATP-binding cassette domain-containing protein [Gordonia mangrovi]
MGVRPRNAQGHNVSTSVVDPAVTVRDLHKSFESVHALNGVTFDVPRGGVLGILGPNGAGKTTLVDVLCTLIAPDSGSAEVCGHDLVDDPAGVRNVISMTGQYAALDETLGGRDNLVFFGRMLGLRRGAARERADYLLERFGLTDAAKRPVYAYSGGMRRRLDIACGLVTRPSVMFLDEPTTGLDPRSRQAVWSLVETLRADGITTLLTTQYLEEADLLSDNIIVMDRGRVVAEGSADSLKHQVGGTYCEAILRNPNQSTTLVVAITRELGAAHRASVSDNGAVTLAAPDGVQTMEQVITLARTAGVGLVDVGLRKPTLDDVFLTLTGSTADQVGVGR